MKNSKSEATEDKKRATNKSALDSFKLFYEEIPLEVAKQNPVDPHKPKDRLVRRSRHK